MTILDCTADEVMGIFNEYFAPTLDDHVGMEFIYDEGNFKAS